jgi:hypothetical protein
MDSPPKHVDTCNIQNHELSLLHPLLPHPSAPHPHTPTPLAALHPLSPYPSFSPPGKEQRRNKERRASVTTQKFTRNKNHNYRIFLK